MMNLYAGREIHPLQIDSRIRGVVPDRKLQDELRRYAGTYFNRHEMKCVGVHLIPHYNNKLKFMQFAFTYELLQGLWCRKYSITLPRPNSSKVVEFTFTFGFRGDFSGFCAVVWLCDQLATSLEWPTKTS